MTNKKPAAQPVKQVRKRGKTKSSIRRDEFGMTVMERGFADKYLETGNGKKSAIFAGYSEKTAENQATVILRRLQVADYIKMRRDELSKAVGVTAERALQEVARLAFFDVRKLFDDEGKPMPISALDDATAAAIVGLKVVTKGNAEMGLADVLEYKLADKNSALDKLMKHLGLYEKDNRQKDSLDELLAAIVNRSRGIDGYGE